MDWTHLIRDFITLWVVVDPIGTIPVYLYAVSGVPRHLHRRFAARAVVIAAGVLLVFLLGGQIVLEMLGLRLGSFQIAGGIVLFLFAMTMIFGESKAEAEIAEAERGDDGAHLAGAVFPLAIPSIASPGAMLAIVILTDNSTNTMAQQAMTASILILVLACTLGLMLVANLVHRFIGDTGASVISRVMGIILATIAVDAVLGGFDHLGIVDVAPPATEGGILDAEG